MPTTSNFGWTTPADTDLVKDGAAAIRTLGNGIDTSFLDLKGGTTGQILSKASNTDLDFTWTAGGDITEVQAGVGISVASGTGPIPVITNSSTDLITTAGDLLYGTAADTLARLGIGTAGQVLKVNSGATAPEWGAAPSPSFVGCKAYHNTTQSISGAYTQVSFDSEVFDTDGFHSTTTNTSRFTIPSGKNGKYRISFGGLMGNVAQDAKITARIYKNGTGQSLTTVWNSQFGDGAIQITDIFDLVATDYLEIYLSQSSGSNKDLEGGTTYNWVTLQYLGA